MGLRRTIARGLDRIIGTSGTRRLRRVESGTRRRLINALDVDARRRPAPGSQLKQATAEPAATTPAEQAPAPLSREQLIDEIGRRSPPGVSHLAPGDLEWAKPDPYTPIPVPTGTRHSVLTGLHEQLRPRTYVEIGIDLGSSLTLSRTRSIAVDPAFSITAPIQCDLWIHKTTSDEFFAAPDAFEHFGGVPVDLAFIDGMHLAEYALRDFMHMEKHMAPGGVIVLDDMLPRNSLEAYRIRRTNNWTGDVYKVHQVLQAYRPDLTVIPVNTRPTGSYLVVGLDPSSTVLDEHYITIEPTITGADPQVVPQDWLERRTAVDATVLLAFDGWARVVELRSAGARADAFASLWKELAALPPAVAG